MFSMICTWINAWENIREAGDLRRYRGHYDAIVMLTEPSVNFLLGWPCGGGMRLIDEIPGNKTSPDLIWQHLLFFYVYFYERSS